MATKIIHKKSSVADKVPLPTDIDVGELALNLSDQRIYSKQGDGTVVQMGRDTFDLVTLDQMQLTTGSVIDIQQAGQLAWDADNGTVSIGLNSNVILQLGQEEYILCKAAEDLTNGDVVYASGAVGASGNIEVSKYIANNTIDEIYVVGVATESALTGESVYITTFGAVRGINTSSYSDGTVLYASPTTAGALTSTKPEAPDQSITVAMVVNSNINGTLFVRPTSGFHLDGLHDVHITSPTNGQLLTWDNANSRWINADAPVSLPDQTGQTGNFLTSNGTSANWTGITESDITDFGVYEPADSTILKDADIGVTVQSFDVDTVIDAFYVHTDNNYTTTEKNKLSGVENNATADQVASEVPYTNTISSLLATDVQAAVDEVEGRLDTAETKLAGIESGATADQTAGEIKTAYESNADTNVFTDSEKTKLGAIEAGATADQTKTDIDALGIDAATVNGLTVATPVPAGAVFTDTDTVTPINDATPSTTSVYSSAKVDELVGSAGGSSAKQYVASGAGLMGDVVVLNSDGTVSAVSQTALVSGIESATGITHSVTARTAMAYDAINNVVAVAYKGLGNDLFLLIGSISGTTITFGSATTVETSTIGSVDLLSMPGGGFVIAYTVTSRGNAVVRAFTTTGGSINTLNSGVNVISSINTSSAVRMAYDSDTDTYLVAASDNSPSQVVARLFSVTGTTVSSLGSKVGVLSGELATNGWGLVYSTSAECFILSGFAIGSGKGHIVTLTSDGTDVTIAATFVRPANTRNTQSVSTILDNGLLVTVWRTVPMTIDVDKINSATDISLLNTFTDDAVSQNVGNQINSQIFAGVGGALYVDYEDTASGSANILAYNVSPQGDVRPCSEVTTYSGDLEASALALIGTNMLAHWYVKSDGSQWTNVIEPPLLNYFNFIGFAQSDFSDGETAEVSLVGSIDENQSGLTLHAPYYVQVDGTLATEPDRVEVLAGKAVAADTLVIGIA